MNAVGYPLSRTQLAYAQISEEMGEEADPGVRAGLLRALEILSEIDPDVDPGEVEDDRSYSPEPPREMPGAAPVAKLQAEYRAGLE